jgi:hypothetical protein
LYYISLWIKFIILRPIWIDGTNRPKRKRVETIFPTLVWRKPLSLFPSASGELKSVVDPSSCSPPSPQKRLRTSSWRSTTLNASSISKRGRIKRLALPLTLTGRSISLSLPRLRERHQERWWLGRSDRPWNYAWRLIYWPTASSSIPSLWSQTSSPAVSASKLQPQPKKTIGRWF